MQNKDSVRMMLDEHIRDWKILIEALSYPVSIHDTEYNVVMANKGFIDVCGRTDVAGMKCYKLIHCKDQPVETCPMTKTLKTGNPESSEIYEPMLKKHLLVKTSPIFVENDLIGVVHSAMDITEIEESEKSYKELTEILGETLNKVKKREQFLQRGRDAFLNMLEDITESHKELEDLFMGLIRGMVNALDAKSHWTRGHSERVTEYAEKIAREIGLKENEIRNLRLAGLLHDIGKIGTYDYLLNKPAKLSDDEFSIIKKHPAKGAGILKEIKQLKDVIPFIRHHHERIDGRGYPDGLKGEDIPLGARILHAADSFDAMTADRPYRPAPGIEYAISELKKHAGSQFDPQVVDVFIRVLKREKNVD